MSELTLQSKSSARLLMAIELSSKSWKLGFSNGSTIRIKTIDAWDSSALITEVSRAKERLKLPSDCPVFSCYEAGREAFSVHRALETWGVSKNIVVDPSSIQVDRRARRAKTDRIDVQKLVELLRRSLDGERDAPRVVRVPTREQEDERRVHRELENLQKDVNRYGARIRSFLCTLGLKIAVGPGFGERIEEARQFDGAPIPDQTKHELLRLYERIELAKKQAAQIESERRAAFKQALKGSGSPSAKLVAELARLKGIGMHSAWILVYEFFGWRGFRNGKEVAACAGLTPTPYLSGSSVNVEQGISKAGNPRIRRLMVELAWCWLRYQPNSQLTQWFHRRFSGGGGSRMRRVGIVALARKLLVALWRYLERGEVPAEAELKTEFLEAA